MRIDTLRPGQLIAYLKIVLTEHRALLEQTPRLAPWLSDLEADLAALRSSSSAESPSDAPNAEEDAIDGRELDRRNEAATRALRLYLQLGRELEEAQGNSATAEAWDSALDYTFDQGLAFLNTSWGEQAASAERVVTLARSEEIPAAVTSSSAHGFSYDAIVSLVESTGQELDAAEDTRRQREEVSSPSPQLSQAHRRASFNLTTFRDLSARILTPDQHQKLFTELFNMFPAPTPPQPSTPEPTSPPS